MPSSPIRSPTSRMADRIFDFVSGTPEAMHMITFLFSPWGIPANYRQMQGSGVNTYKWVNKDGTGGAGEVSLGAAAGQSKT